MTHLEPVAWCLIPVPFLLLGAYFNRRCEGVVVRVEDYATDEVLDDMGIASEHCEMASGGVRKAARMKMPSST